MRLIGGYGAALIAVVVATTVTSAAHAEVYEVSATGTVMDITHHEWRPAPVAVPRRAAVAETRQPSPPIAPHIAQIEAAAQDYGLSPALVKAVAWQESRFNPRARSPAGALGIMQLMPDTARQLGVTDPFDPVQNIRGGAAYLKQQLDRFGSDLPRALAAYNAGPKAVIRYGGVPPYSETRAYVSSILARLAAEIDFTVPSTGTLNR